jgi:hypothetical protein
MIGGKQKVCPTSTKYGANYRLVNVPFGHILKREQPPRPRNVTGKQIRLLRKHAKPKISQEDLCGRLARHGVTLTRPQLAKIEGGRRPVFDYEAIAFAKALKVTLAEIFQPAG